MKCHSVVVFFMWAVLCTNNAYAADDTNITKSQDPFFLEFSLIREGRKSIKFTENESISFMDGDELDIKCTSKHVHVWEGGLDHKKFIPKIGTITRNSTGHFTSYVNVTLQSTLPFSNRTFLVCKELEKKPNSKCIHFHSERQTNSNESKKEGTQCLVVTVDTCPQFATDENKNFPRAKNTQPSSVLDFNVPYFQLVDGAHVTFYGKASKQTIIQSPEVLITYKDGKDVRLDVEILPEPQNKTTGQYYKFKMAANISLIMTKITVVGYCYDTREPIVVKKDLNVTVGLPPKIEGLPSKIELYQDNSNSYFRFRVFGHPHPELTLSFNDETINGNDPRYKIYQHAVGNYTFHIRKIADERVAGKFKITAINLIGKFQKSINFQANFQWTLADARLIGFGIFITLFSLIIICIVICKPRNDGKPEPIAHNANELELRERTEERCLGDVCNSAKMEEL